MFSWLDYDTLQRIKPGGAEDLRQWSKMGLAAVMCNPLVIKTISKALEGVIPPEPKYLADALLSPAPIVAAAGLMSVWGGYKIGETVANRIPATSKTALFHSDVAVKPHPYLPSAETIQSWNGMMIGYRVQDGEPIILNWDQWMRHCFIVGQSGVGKTVLGEWLMFQQIMHGGGLLFVDGKLDEKNLAKIFQMAAYACRREDVLVINPGNPKNSNTYNPILYGDADEVAARILSLIPSTETNPGADHYRQSANQALTTLVGAIQSIPANASVPGVNGMAYNFLDLSILLQNAKAILELEERVPESTDGGRQFKLWLDQFKTKSDGNVGVDLKKMRDLFGGVGGRMHQFGTGNFGQITSTYSPEVNLFEAITSNKIVYVALPTMGKAEAASNFGKMLVGDYRTAVSWIQALPEHRRPWPPTLCFFDEAGSYVTQAWSRIFEQARSAHQALVPAVQTLANLDAVSKELSAMVMGNTNTKVIFRIGESDTITRVTELIGKETVGQRSYSVSTSSGASGNAAGLSDETRNSGEGASVGVREAEAERVKPTTIARLGIGEAIVLIENSKLHHVKIPAVNFDESVIKKTETIEINRRKVRWVKGLDLYSAANKYLTKAD